MSLTSKLLRFSGVFLLAFAVLSLIWPLVVPGYNRLVIGLSNELLTLFEDPLIITLRSQGENVLVYQIEEAGEEAQLVLGYKGYMYFNIALLLALFLATPELRVLRRVNLSLVGLTMMFAFHTLVLTINGVEKYIHQTSVSGTHSYSVGSLYVFFWFVVVLSVGAKLAPVVIWGILTFKYWLPKPQVVAKASSTEKIGRNESCPCDSGKKYKHCHGKK